MTWLICHSPTDLILTSIAGSPIVWCARANNASDDRSGSPCAGSYMNSITHSVHGLTHIHVPLPTQKSLPGWLIQYRTPGRCAVYLVKSASSQTLTEAPSPICPCKGKPSWEATVLRPPSDGGRSTVASQLGFPLHGHMQI